MSLLSNVELLGRLVAFDSTSRNSNLPIADFVSDYLDRPGVRVERNPSPDGDKTNLVVTVDGETDPPGRERPGRERPAHDRPGQDRPGLTLCGHLDVVPAEEPEWESDPFALTTTEDRLIGRGACDMKGFVALAVNALARADRRRLRHPLALLLTYDEEVGTLGARHFVVSWSRGRPLPRRTIVGEPTSLAAVRMHKGFCGLRIVLAGQSAHSGYPHLGDSAIEPAGRVIGALETLRRALDGERHPSSEHFGEVPQVALNIGRIRGGTAVNVVPDRCELEVSVRVLPGMDTAPILERVRRAVADALGERAFDFEEDHDSPPFLLAEDHDLYRGICQILGQRETVAASYATDAGWLQQSGLDCLVWGPGSIEVAHRPNEWMPRDEFRRGGELLEQVIGRFCAAR